MTKHLILMLFITANLFGQQYLGDYKIAVEGVATKIIESDRASFTFSVIGFGESLRDAITDARNKVSNATKVLAKFNIPANRISTSTFESGANFGDKAFLSSSKDFQTQMTVYVIVDSLKNLEEIIVGLSEIGLESITNINYSLHNRDKYVDQIKIDAIKNAKSKAETIAKELDINLGKVIYVGTVGLTQSYPNPFNPSTKIHYGSTSRLTSLYSKPVKLNHRIRVVYAIN